MSTSPPAELRFHRIRRTIAVTLAAMLTAAVTVLAVPGAAWALGPGKSCLYLAPSGASGLGHVGWEIQEPGHGFWAGATELGTGNPADTWSRFSTSETTIHGYFHNALNANGKVQHTARYYTEFRCHSTSSSAVGAALARARSLATGYNLVTDNCLTKSVSIFTTYWGGDNLDSGIAWTPNAYFFNYLPGIPWGPEHFL